jgi:hypothetical protein
MQKQKHKRDNFGNIKITKYKESTKRFKRGIYLNNRKRKAGMFEYFIIVIIKIHSFK